MHTRFWAQLRAEWNQEMLFKTFIIANFGRLLTRFWVQNRATKFFQRIMTIVTLFILSVLLSCIYIQSTTVIEKIRKKIEWMPSSIHTRSWTQFEIKRSILGPIEVFSKYWKLWLLSCPSSLKILINIANNIASLNLVVVTVYTHKIKLGVFQLNCFSLAHF